MRVIKNIPNWKTKAGDFACRVFSQRLAAHALGETSNAEHRTLNVQWNKFASFSSFDVRRSMFDVRCFSSQNPFPPCTVSEQLLEALLTAKMQRPKMCFSFHQSVRASISFETTGSGTQCVARRSNTSWRARFPRCKTADWSSIFALPRGFYEEKTPVRKHQQTTSKERTLNSANN